jgi:hypothetical protein
MSVRGLLGGLIGMAIMAGAIALAVVVFANSVVVQQVDGLMARLRDAGATRATYKTAEADLMSRSISVTGIDVQSRDKDVFRIERIDVDRFDFFNPRHPRYADIRLSGGAIIAGDGSPLSALLRQVGLTRLTGKIRLSFTAEHDKRLFSLKGFTIDTPELGVLSISGRFGNWSRAVLVALQRAAAGSGPDAFRRSRLVIYEARVDYRDRGLVNRYLRFLAARRDTKLSKLKAGIRRDLRKIRRELKGPKLAPVREMIDVLAAFIRKPGGLTITAEPGSGVQLDKLVAMDLTSLKSRLQLSIKAN